MTAREKLIRLVRENTPDYGNHFPCDPETGFMFMGQEEYLQHVGKLLDEHAHELAAEQRRHVRHQGHNPLHYGSAHWAMIGVDEAADLIDPHVGK
jgi:hypothetical protein